ncbi:MAG: hypothetical protein ACU0B7_14930 [Paracoccaceae bacterium]
MSKHTEKQMRLKTVIQEAILNEGCVEGSDEIVLINTDVIEALLELTGLYASFHEFENYSSVILAATHAETIMGHIDRFYDLRKQGKLPFTFVPRRSVN